jgi:hypothetical protein
LAQTQEEVHQRLRELTPADSAALAAMWQATADAHVAALSAPPPRTAVPGPAQFLILITCRDENHQVELLGRFAGEGLECSALLS